MMGKHPKPQSTFANKNLGSPKAIQVLPNKSKFNR
jgi:hypothetical protein